MADWVCTRCGVTEKFWDAQFHECTKPVIICPNCYLTKPCECDDD